MNQFENENVDIKDKEISNKSKKPLLFVSIGSVVAMFLFSTLFSLSAIGLLSLILIPALFAFPIMKGSPKLVIIPSAVFLLSVCIISFMSMELYLIPLFLLNLTLKMNLVIR